MADSTTPTPDSAPKPPAAESPDAAPAAAPTTATPSVVTASESAPSAEQSLPPAAADVKPEPAPEAVAEAKSAPVAESQPVAKPASEPPPEPESKQPEPRVRDAEPVRKDETETLENIWRDRPPPTVVPEVNGDDCEELDPEIALEKLKAGEHLKKVKIKHLDASGIRFEHPVVIRESLIVRPNFQAAVFEQGADFGKSTFVGTIKFGDTYDGFKMSKSWKPELGAHFKGPLNFAECVFKGAFFAGGVVCESTVNFRPSVFLNFAAFPAATFHEKVWFVKAHFQKWFSVLECRFLGELADFSSSVFDSDASFSRTSFRQRASFWGTTFKGDTSFYRAKFHGDSNFFRCRFTGNFDMANSVHERPIDLRSTELAGTLNFHLLEAPRVLVGRRQIENRFASEKRGMMRAARNDYAQFRVIFEANHDYRATDWAYYHFRRCARQVSGRNWFVRAVEWLVLDLGSGYGTKPFNIGILMGLCILLFTGIYALFPGEFFYNTDNVPTMSLDLSNALYFSVATFTTMGFGDWNPKGDSIMRFVVILEAFIGLFLVALFVAMLTRKVIR